MLCTVLTQTTPNLVRPLVTYRAVALGGDATDVGIITAAFAVLPLILAIPLGRLGDRLVRFGPLLATGTVMIAGGTAFLAVVNALPGLALGNAVIGMGQLAFLSSAQAMIARWSGSSLDRGFGWFTAALAVGQLLGPLLAGAILGSTTGAALLEAGEYAFAVGAVVALLALPVVPLVARGMPRNPPRPAARDHEPVSSVALLRRPGVPAGLFASLALLAAADVLTAFLPLIADGRGISPSVVGVLLALRAAATICSRLLLDRLTRRWRHEVLVTASALGSALAFAVLPLPGVGAVGMGVALTVGGFLLGVGQPLTMTIVVGLVPIQARGHGLALRLVANRLGQVTIPSVAAVAAGSAGAAGALWVACLVLAAASFMPARD